jgi:hypothetical protein
MNPVSKESSEHSLRCIRCQCKLGQIDKSMMQEGEQGVLLCVNCVKHVMKGSMIDA